MSPAVINTLISVVLWIALIFGFGWLFTKKKLPGKKRKWLLLFVSFGLTNIVFKFFVYLNREYIHYNSKLTYDLITMLLFFVIPVLVTWLLSSLLFKPKGIDIEVIGE